MLSLMKSALFGMKNSSTSLPFELQFKMNFGSYSDQSLGPNNNSGADGMMFVLQNQILLHLAARKAWDMDL